MVAVAVGSRLYAKVSDLDDLPPTLMDEIEQFFINYNTMRGHVCKPTRGRRPQLDLGLTPASSAVRRMKFTTVSSPAKQRRQLLQ
jgi:inorganic pyrophosphatase